MSCYPSCTQQGSRQRYQFWNISTVLTQSVSPEASSDKYPVVANCTPDGMWWCLRRKQQWPMRRHYFGISREVMRKVATVHLYLFICSFFYYVLFNDAFSVTKTNYVASNEREITQWWIERKRLWPKLRYYSYVLLERRRKTTKTSIRITRLLAYIWTRDLPNAKHKC
jgi:hypothetical protein